MSTSEKLRCLEAILAEVQERIKEVAPESAGVLLVSLHDPSTGETASFRQRWGDHYARQGLVAYAHEGYKEKSRDDAARYLNEIDSDD